MKKKNMQLIIILVILQLIVRQRICGVDIMKAPEVYLASNLDGMISDNYVGYIGV